MAPWPATCSEPTPRNQEECLASPPPIPAEEEARPGGVRPLPGYRASATWQLGPKVEPPWRGRLAPSPPWPGEGGAFVCRVLYFSAHILFCLYKREKNPLLKNGGHLESDLVYVEQDPAACLPTSPDLLTQGHRMLSFPTSPQRDLLAVPGLASWGAGGIFWTFAHQ